MNPSISNPTDPKRALELARQTLQIEAEAVLGLIDRLDDSFAAAVALIRNCQGRLIVSGIGKSGHIARKIASTMSSTGTPAYFVHPAEACHGDLGMITRDDLLLALSNSGESEELILIVPLIKRQGAKLVAITGNPQSTLARQADVHLDAGVPREACPLNLAPTASTTATLVMGDALAMAVLKARGFKQSDFARFHPAGAIGRAMLLRVGDIMRTGPRNAVAPQTLPVKEALLIMTRARSGSLSVVDARGRLAGVFTDGDFRRCMAEDPDLLQRPLRSVMTRRPVCIREDALAVEALKIFNDRNIDDLIVINARREPIGMVDSQDLPKLKIV